MAGGRQLLVLPVDVAPEHVIAAETLAAEHARHGDGGGEQRALEDGS